MIVIGANGDGVRDWMHRYWLYLREAGTRPTGDGKPMGRGPREDSIYMLCLPLKYGSPYWGTGEVNGEINNKKNERVMLSL